MVFSQDNNGCVRILGDSKISLDPSEFDSLLGKSSSNQPNKIDHIQHWSTGRPVKVLSRGDTVVVVAWARYLGIFVANCAASRGS